MSNSKIKNLAIGTTLAVMGAWLAPASAQYVGPSAKVTATTVAQILEASKDDDKVSLKGHLIRQASREKYVFTDGSGEIHVEIDDDVFPKVPVDDKTAVQIRGEVDKGMTGRIEIDVDAMEILK
jgi:uncharacterized protein (TIGR00156 family)